MKKLKSVKVTPSTPVVPGTGILTIQGWTGASSGLEVAIVENQKGYCLQLNGSWESKECWFKCPFVADEATGELRINVGNFLVNPLLLNGSSVMHQLKLREEGNSDTQAVGVIMHSPSLLADPAAGSADIGSYVFEMPGVTPAPVEAVSIPEPEPTPEPEPEPIVKPEVNVEPPPVPEPIDDPKDEPIPDPVPGPAPQKSWVKWLVAFVVLLALIAAGVAVWWFVLRAPAGTQEPEQVPAAATAQAAAPCSVEAMAESSEMAFVQSCVAQSPSSEELLATIQSAKAAEHCGIAQRLYANRAQAGDLLIAEAYAKEYDPQFHQASKCFETPEADTAVYWWETIVSFDAGNALAAERLKELKP